MVDFKKLLDERRNPTVKPMENISTKLVFNIEQLLAIETCDNFIKNGNPNDYFLIDGKAGTGKTTIVAEILKKHRNKSILACALSHKAKYVIQNVLVKNGIEASFYSIAGALGMDLDLETGLFKNSFRNHKDRPIFNASIIIVDEASMVNEEMIELLFQYKRKDSKIIFIGDVGQLPPIRSTENPYYNSWEIDSLDTISPVFNTKNKSSLLERIRQGEDSPILPFADIFWENSQKEIPLYNPIEEKDRKTIITKKGALIFVNKSVNIMNQLLPIFKQSTTTNNKNLIKFVVYRNKVKELINTHIHNKLFDNSENIFCVGDLIIFNDTYEKIENSTEAQVLEVSEIYTTEKYNIKYYNCTLDVQIDEKRSASIVKVLHPDSIDMYDTLVKDLFKLAFSYKNNVAKRTMYIELLQHAWSVKKMFANIDYSYGITSHKSQGSTYEITIIHEQDINSVNPTTNRAKSQSIYTALTRPQNIAIVISEDEVENDIDFNKFDLIELNNNINNNKK